MFHVSKQQPAKCSAELLSKYITKMRFIPKCLQRSLPRDYYYHATISNEKVGSGSIQPTLSYFFTIKQHRGKSHGHYFHQTLTYTTLTNVQVLATVEPTQPKSRARSFLRTRIDPPW